MLRWTDEQHAAWKARQAREYAQQESTSVSVDGHAAGQHGGGSAPAARSGASTTRNLGNPTAPAGHGAGVEPGPLTLPWPPTGNHAVKHGNGNHYMRPEVRAYRAAVAAICANSMSYMRELSVIVQDDVRYGWVKVKADPCA